MNVCIIFFFKNISDIFTFYLFLFQKEEALNKARSISVAENKREEHEMAIETGFSV